MLRTLDSHQGLTCYAATAVQDLPWSDLRTMLDDAWQADYQGQMRLTLDDTFLHQLLVDQDWLAILLCTTEGQPVGFELAFPRTLYCQQQPLRVYANTLFTVSAQHRRRGIGRLILHWVNQVLLNEQQSEGILVTFHPGHAGLPTVQKTHEHTSELAMQVFHSAPIWGRRLDRALLPALPRPPVAVRLAWPATSAESMSVVTDAAAQQPWLPQAATLDAVLRRSYQVAFGVEHSYQRRYLQADTPSMGTYWYAFHEDVACTLSFDTVAVQCDTQQMGLLGRLQAVHNQHCTTAQLQQALAHLCQMFQQQGCFLAGVLDHGVLPLEVFTGLGFRATGDSRLYLIRGHADTVEPFRTVRAPYFLDLL